MEIRNFLSFIHTLQIVIPYIHSPSTSFELEELNLEGNRLTRLDTINPFNFPKLTSLGIRNNLLSCKYLNQFVEENLDQWHDLKLIGNLWEQADDFDVDCKGKSKNKTIIQQTN